MKIARKMAGMRARVVCALQDMGNSEQDGYG